MSESPKKNVRFAESHQIATRYFELTLLWPVLIQWRRNDSDQSAPDAADPDGPRGELCLDKWVEILQESKNWQEIRGAYPPLANDREAEAAYAEFCYFHPFVRNFLYVNRDDIRQYRRQTQNDKMHDPQVIKNSINRNLRILERLDLDALQVEYEMDPSPEPPKEKSQASQSHSSNKKRLTTEFQMQSCWLYLFDTRVALLELRLRHDASWIGTGPARPAHDQLLPLNLRMVLRLQDIVRRVYAPYWEVFRDEAAGLTTHKGGHVPDILRLIRKSDRTSTGEMPALRTDGEHSLGFGSFATSLSIDDVQACRYGLPSTQQASSSQSTSDADKQAVAGMKIAREHREHVYFHREPYTHRVWRSLLEPILPTTEDPRKWTARSLRFEHIEDERVPVMSYLAVDDPREISTGDWLRLASIDDEGNSEAYPYSPEFVARNPLSEFVYDRFWYSPTGPKVDKYAWQSTRWLCSGHGFVAVGVASERQRSADGRIGSDNFFSDAHAGALAHYRHHYFALGLIAHFHRASLLRFKHALAEYSDELLNGEEPEKRFRMFDFRVKMERLMEELLRFRTRYWFAEVSNQIQGRELFDLYKRHLNTVPIYEDVCRDAESTAALLRQWEEHEQSRTERSITYLGALFLAIAPTLAVVNKVWEHAPVQCAWLLFGTLLFAILAVVEIPWIPPQRHVVRRNLVRFCYAHRRAIRRIAALLAILCGLGLVSYGDWGGASDHAPTTSMGSNSSAASSAPQNPRSGNAPPDQDAGGGGDRSTSQATRSPRP